MEQLEDKLERFQKQLNFSVATEQSDFGMHENQNIVSVDSLTKELHLLSSENVTQCYVF